MRCLAVFQALLLLLMPGWAAAAGTVIAIGGALRDDNTAVWQRVVQAAGGPGANIAVIATASGDPARSGAHLVAQLQRHGARAEVAQDAASVATAGGVFFSGGAQARLLDALQPGGRSTPMLDAVRSVLARGGVVAGTSSGAAVLSVHAFRDVPDLLAAMSAPLRPGQEIDTGFALLPAQVVVDQHFLQRGRIGRLLPLMVARQVPLGLGVDEDTAVVVQGDAVEVIGRRAVLVADLAGARHDATAGAFNLRGARLSLLRPGDRYDLATRRAQPAPAARPQAPGRRALAPADAWYPDMLAANMLVTAITRLMESDADAVRGLAFRTGQALGFEWRLHKGAETAGWGPDSGDDGSVVNLLLDVLPVRMAQPLHQPHQP